MRTLVFDILLLAASKAPNFVELAEVDLESSTTAVGAKASALDPARTWRVGSARGLALSRCRPHHPGLAAAGRQRGEASPIVAAAQMSQTGTDRWLNLSVRDSGPGIPPAAQERIFERFSQLGSSGATEGSGLGLSIVSAIAEAHGGSVLLSGAPGEGSTFRIRVPLVAEAQPSQADEEKR